MASAGFNPTARVLNPPEPPDYLSNAVLQSLSRPPFEKYSWGAFATFVFGGLTFGLLPLLMAMRRHREYILTERDQLHHLSDWLRIQFTGAAGALPEIPEEIDRGIQPFYLLSMLSGFVTLWIVLSHTFHGGWKYGELVRVAYGTPWMLIATWQRIGSPWLDWLVPAMTAGHLSHWLMGVMHSINSRRYVRKFNGVALQVGLSPVELPALSLGFRPLWVVGAILFLALHAPWAAVMMLAGASQRRYIRLDGMKIRLALAQRVRDILAVKRPLAAVPVSAALRNRCRDDQCRAALPVLAKFCPRCGRRVTEEVDRIA